MRWRPRSFALLGFIGIVLILYYVEYYMRHSVIKLQPEYGGSPRLDSTALYLCEPLPPWFGSPDNNGSLELCPQANILTVEQGGRLGNQIWEYASVWALAKEIPTLSPFIPHCLRRVLDDAFPSLSIPELVEPPQESCELEPVPSSTREDVMAFLKRGKSGNMSHNIVLRKWITLQELVLPRIRELRERDFRFHPELERGTLRILSSAAKTLYGPHFDTSRVTYIGVHVRRTDYISYLTRADLQPAGADYYRAAMQWFRGRLSPHVAFLVVSDDLSWCRENLVKPWKDVFLVLRDGRDTPQADLALMAACNHSILDYGTFGVWGALLSGGETLVYRLSAGNAKSHAEEVAGMMPHWQLFP